MITDLELAEVGYNEYGRSTEWKNYRGLPMPSWEELPQPQKGAWQEAARAMRDRIEEHNG